MDPQVLQQLQSASTSLNKKGCQTVINTASEAYKIPNIISAGVLEELSLLLYTDDEELLEKVAWALSNISTFETGRIAITKSGALERWACVMKSGRMNVIEKACSCIASCALYEPSIDLILNRGIFLWLISLITEGANDDIKFYALKPLANVLRFENTQKLFVANKGIPPLIKLLGSSRNDIGEYAALVASHMSSKLDVARQHLLQNGIMKPLNPLILGHGSEKAQLLAANVLVNLANTQRGELIILESRAIFPIIHMLSGRSPSLVKAAANLLSNLFVNQNIRDQLRNVAWPKPFMSALTACTDNETKIALLRALSHLAKDGYARVMLGNAQADRALSLMNHRETDKTIKMLCVGIVATFNVPVIGSIVRQVEEAEARGLISLKDTATDDPSKDLAKALGGIQLSSEPRVYVPREPPPAAAPVQEVVQVSTVSSPPAQLPVAKPASNPAPVITGSVHVAPVNPPAHHQTPRPAPVNNNYSSSDSLLDDLLAGAGHSPQQSYQPPPIHNYHPPQHVPVSHQATPRPPANNNYSSSDSLLDDLLAGAGHSAPPAGYQNSADSLLDDLLASGGHQHNPPISPSLPLHSVDSMLDDLMGGGGSHHAATPRPNPHGSVDSLLDELMGPPTPQPHRPPHQQEAAEEAVDDLLDILMGGQQPSPRAPSPVLQTATVADLLDELEDDSPYMPKTDINNYPGNRKSLALESLMDEVESIALLSKLPDPETAPINPIERKSDFQIHATGYQSQFKPKQAPAAIQPMITIQSRSSPGPSTVSHEVHQPSQSHMQHVPNSSSNPSSQRPKPNPASPQLDPFSQTIRPATEPTPAATPAPGFGQNRPASPMPQHALQNQTVVKETSKRGSRTIVSTTARTKDEAINELDHLLGSLEGLIQHQVKYFQTEKEKKELNSKNLDSIKSDSATLLAQAHALEGKTGRTRAVKSDRRSLLLDKKKPGAS